MERRERVKQKCADRHNQLLSSQALQEFKRDAEEVIGNTHPSGEGQKGLFVPHQFGISAPGLSNQPNERELNKMNVQNKNSLLIQMPTSWNSSHVCICWNITLNPFCYILLIPSMLNIAQMQKCESYRFAGLKKPVADFRRLILYNCCFVYK